MESKGLVVYASKTGNTKKVAQGVAARLGAALVDAAEFAEEEKREGKKKKIPHGTPWIFAGFWVDKGTACGDIAAFLSGLEGQNVGLFGTLGAEPDSRHARDTAEKVRALVSAKNRCLGCFLCQGKIDPALTEAFKKFPPGHPHHMSEERMRRHIAAAEHPNQADVEAAADACAAMLRDAGLSPAGEA